MKKVVLLAFEGKEMCFLHVLANALDMQEKGYDVKIIMEGASTVAAAAMGEVGHNFYDIYTQVKEKGLIDCVCKACAMKMGAFKDLEKQGLTFRGEMKGHPSLATYIDDGYQIITF